MNEKSVSNNTPVRKLIPIPQFNNYHPDPSPSALRWLVFTKKDGFERCIVRRGRRVLIDEIEYFKWLENQDKNNPNSTTTDDRIKPL